MAGYFEVQIKEGLVSNLTCPEEKCDSQALPNQARNITKNYFVPMYFQVKKIYRIVSFVIFCASVVFV